MVLNLWSERSSPSQVYREILIWKTFKATRFTKKLGLSKRDFDIFYCLPCMAYSVDKLREETRMYVYVTPCTRRNTKKNFTKCLLCKYWANHTAAATRCYQSCILLATASMRCLELSNSRKTFYPIPSFLQENVSLKTVTEINNYESSRLRDHLCQMAC